MTKHDARKLLNSVIERYLLTQDENDMPNTPSALMDDFASYLKAHEVE